MNHLKDANTAQVLIIGAGISGLEAARLLRQNGIKTLVWKHEIEPVVESGQYARKVALCLI